MGNRRKIVSINDEWDMTIDPNPEFGSLEDLFILRAEEKLNEQISEVIENALEELPEIQRSIIIIRYFLEGEDRYTAQQIAKILGVSRKTYYNHLNCALNNLKNLVEHHPVIDKKLSDTRKA